MADGATRSDPPPAALKIFLVAVEESGDRLGAALMRALRERTGGAIAFAGVGGRGMVAEGLTSLHSIDDFSIIGLSSIPQRLPRIMRHLRDTLHALRRGRPDALIVIDSPGYNLWLARFAHRANPALRIFSYVSPSVWAWRPQRARAMRRFINHVLALLPFEPAAHQRLGGPPCSYVGHPIIAEVSALRPDAMARALGNLIGNAIRYGGQVWVRVGCRRDAAEVLIDDDGPGIPAEQREEVFKPFTRLEQSRNVGTGGVGLGLTIARDIVRTHGGDLLLEDSPLGGVRARVRLPL